MSVLPATLPAKDRLRGNQPLTEDQVQMWIDLLGDDLAYFYGRLPPESKRSAAVKARLALFGNELLATAGCLNRKIIVRELV